VVVAASVIALIVLDASVAQADSPEPAAAGGLKTAKIGGVTVLTNANGLTLYSFAPDTPAISKGTFCR
jgi:predicted lipoprotein with Yx(FWY)xxD motif